MTIDELFTIIFRDHWSQEKFKISGYSAEVERIYERHIKEKFGLQTLQKINLANVRLWHQGLKHIPAGANDALKVMSKMFSFAIAETYFDGANPCAAIRPFREKSRKRYATEDEISKIGEVLKKEINKTASIFIFSILYTGSRPRALERARWQDLRELSNGYHILEFDGKTGEESVIVPPQLMAMIKTLPHRNDGLIFGIKAPRRLWDKIKIQIGAPDLWLRDLRRTFATVGLGRGVKIEAIGELLNHKSAQTTKIYAKLMETEKIKTIETISEQMAKLLGG